MISFVFSYELLTSFTKAIINNAIIYLHACININKNIVFLKLPSGQYCNMVERLANRYELSENLTSQMLQMMNDEVQCGEYSMEDDRYSVVVVKRETDFDIKLFSARITNYARENLVRIE